MFQKRCFGRKAQLTMFFLLGVLMIAVFASIWYINSRRAEVQLAGPTEKIITDLLKTGSVPYYVELCLEKHASEALDMVGKQGGDIFWDQHGPAPNPTKYISVQSTAEVDDVNRVAYGISAPLLHNGTIYPYPPAYPGGINITSQVPELRFGKPGRFGERSLRRLCDVSGANSPFYFDPSRQEEYEAGEKSTYAGLITEPICLYDNYVDILAIQTQMEFYVEQTIKNCTNWTAIKQETGYNVTPTGEPIDIVFRLGLSDVWVDAFIPLVIEVGGREPVYTIGDFHTRFPVRLKQIVEFATLLANYDSYFLAWNLSEQYTGLYEWDPQISVTVLAPYKALDLWDDVVTIMDLGSALDGKPFIFRFSRENRYPALDYIHTTSDWGAEYDIVVMESENLTILPNPETDNLTSPKIYDPDEDNLTYYYTGWRETCEEFFDYDTGVADTSCSHQEPTHPSNYFLFPNKGATPDITSLDWQVGSLLSYAWLRNWTTSPPYADPVFGNRRNATYMPTEDEIGPHNVTVWVCDEAGLCDYQVVKILVVDYPELHLNGTNPYFKIDPSIDFDRASVEDYYRLTAEGTTAYYSPLLGYVFGDPMEPFEITLEHPQQMIDLPRPPPADARHILNIADYNFSRDRLCAYDFNPWDPRPGGDCMSPPENFLNHINHTINLTLAGMDIPPEKMNVSVYQCLPFYDPAHPYPWPYNDTADAFLMSHSCCSPGKEKNFTVFYNDIESDTVTVGPWDMWTMSNPYIRELDANDLDEVWVYDSSGNAVGMASTSSTLAFQGISCTVGYLVDPSPVCVFIPGNKSILVYFNGFGAATEYPQAGVPYGEYTVQLVAKDDFDIPWGSWFGPDHVCYSGDPKIGIYDELMTGFDDTTADSGLAPASKVCDADSSADLDSLFTACDSLANDVVFMEFLRKCSGDRGNICSGEAELTLSSLESCPDMEHEVMSDGQPKEIESCNGPPKNKWYTYGDVIDATPCSECDASECDDGYCDPDSLFSCVPYGINTDRGLTFEHAFGLENFNGDPAEGICNPRPACSDDEERYFADAPSGQFILHSATCWNDGGTGTCTGALEYTDCDYKFSGCPAEAYDYDYTACAVKSCLVKESNTVLKSTYFQCGKPDSFHAQCENSGMYDGDTSPGVCNACNAKYSSQFGGPEWLGEGDQQNCCGDDYWEGGFAFNSASGFLDSPSDSPNAGKFSSGEAACDDTFNPAPGPAKKEIDNDCDTLPNCQDSDCMHTSSLNVNNPNWRTKTGPGGGLCCDSNSRCRNQLSFYTDFTFCDADSECTCTKPGTTSSDYPSEYDGLTESDFPLKTCLPSATAFDFRGVVTISSPKTLTFRVRGVTAADDEVCTEQGGQGPKLLYDYQESDAFNMIGLENSINAGDSTSISDSFRFGLQFASGTPANCYVSIVLS